MRVVTYTERPDLVERISEIGEVWPEFLYHADVPELHWAKVRDEFPGLQLVLYDDERDAVVGRGQTMPASIRDGLPGGIDDMLERNFGDGPRAEADVLSAAVAIVDPRRQGEGLSALVIEGMCRIAREAGFPAVSTTCSSGTSVTVRGQSPTCSQPQSRSSIRAGREKG